MDLRRWRRRAASFLLAAPSTLLAAAALLTAQDCPPAPEVAEFDRMLGTWEGSGRAWRVPGKGAMTWTSRSVVRRVLGGHFLQDDMVVEFSLPDGTAGPGPLVIRTFWGFDRENARHRSLSISNEGRVAASTPRWVDANTMIVFETTQRDRQTRFDRWITRFDQDGYTLTGTRAIDADPPYLHVEGRFSRVPGNEVAAADAGKDGRGAVDAFYTATPFDPTRSAPGGGLARIGDRIAGTYRVTGEMLPPPGSPKTDTHREAGEMLPLPGSPRTDTHRVTGEMRPRPALRIAATEKVSRLFGGSVLYFEQTADPLEGTSGYQGIAAIGFDPNEGRCTMVCDNNLGECRELGCYVLDGKKLVAVDSGLEQGRPTAARHVTVLNDKGELSECISHAISDDLAPVLLFRATYRQQ
jgi:hypothetical protein